MKKEKPISIDYSFVWAAIHLKPWKGKINEIKFLHDESRDLNENVEEMITDFKKRGEHKRRTVIGISIFWSKHIKL